MLGNLLTVVTTSGLRSCLWEKAAEPEEQTKPLFAIPCGFQAALLKAYDSFHT